VLKTFLTFSLLGLSFAANAYISTGSNQQLRKSAFILFINGNGNKVEEDDAWLFAFSSFDSSLLFLGRLVESASLRKAIEFAYTPYIPKVNEKRF
jgi:hypothetical protein